MATGNQPALAGKNYVERYVRAVGELLPAERRKDIEAEIRANLLDEIEASANDSGFPGSPTEQTVLEVLRRYPRPLEMAQRYGATQALIGPVLYASYVTVLKLVLMIVLTVNVVIFLVQIMAGESGLTILGALGSIFSSLFLSGGIVTLIFAIIERSPGVAEEVAEDLDKEQRNWDPRNLPQVSNRNQVSTGDLVGDIITTLVSILFLNVYVGADGSMPIYFGEWVPAPVFSELFMSYVPYLTALWAVELLLYLVVLAQRRWTILTRVIALASLVGTIVVSAVMLNAGQLAANPSWEWAVRMGVGVVIVITVWQIASHVWAMIKNAREGSTNIATALA